MESRRDERAPARRPPPRAPPRTTCRRWPRSRSGDWHEITATPGAQRSRFRPPARERRHEHAPPSAPPPWRGPRAGCRRETSRCGRAHRPPAHGASKPETAPARRYCRRRNDGDAALLRRGHALLDNGRAALAAIAHADDIDARRQALVERRDEIAAARIERKLADMQLGVRRVAAQPVRDGGRRPRMPAHNVPCPTPSCDHDRSSPRPVSMPCLTSPKFGGWSRPRCRSARS